MIKVLHTSDWHLGRELYNQNRIAEFSAWLDWLIETINCECIDVLVVAGDIFDVVNVPTSAQELYYRFLTKACTLCKIFITSGNHDSGRFIDAPAALMKYLSIIAVGKMKDIKDEVFVVRDDQQMPQLIVCAVPFLRLDDLYNSLSDEERTNKEAITKKGLQKHYAAVADYVAQLRQELGQNIPAIAMGHLMTSGAIKGGDDGVRDLYIGTLEDVTDDIFPQDFDYVALGHIHRPQRVNHRDDIRYSGSPIAMGFDERCDEKIVCIITFDGRNKTIETKHIPVFQRLARVESDDIDMILNELKVLAESAESVWVEVNYTGDRAIRDLDTIVEKVLHNTQVRCIHIRNASYVQQLLKDDIIETTELRELDPEYVFDMLLKQEKIEGETADSLRATYKEALHAVHTSDEYAHSSED